MNINDNLLFYSVWHIVLYINARLVYSFGTCHIAGRSPTFF